MRLVGVLGFLLSVLEFWSSACPYQTTMSAISGSVVVVVVVVVWRRGEGRGLIFLCWLSLDLKSVIISLPDFLLNTYCSPRANIEADAQNVKAGQCTA